MAIWVLIPGMVHGDVTDLPYIIATPLGTWPGTKGPTDWRRSHAIINADSLAFFDKYLKGEPEPVLNGRRGDFQRSFSSSDSDHGRRIW